MADAAKSMPFLDPQLVPPEGDDEVGIKVFAILEEVLKDKDDLGLTAKWNRNYDLGRGRHWKTKSKKVPLRKANLIHLFRQRTVNVLTDNNPTFNVTQKTGSEDIEEDKVGKLKRSCEYWWQEEEQQDVFEGSVRQGETYGATIEKVLMNFKLEHGLGEVETVVVDPFHFGFYPTDLRTPREIQTKAKAVLHFYPEYVWKLRGDYPDSYEEIIPDEEYLDKLDDRRKEAGGKASEKTSGFLTTFQNVVKNMINFGGREHGGTGQTLVVECWLRDDSTEERQEITTKNGVAFVKKWNEPKYPGGIRMVKACSGGTVVLEDRLNPSINPTLPLEQAAQTYLFDKIPFTMENSVKDPANAWGMDDIEQLEDLQTEFNKALSQFTLIKDKVARAKLINPADSGVKNEEFTNVPGIINPTSKFSAEGIRYLEPPIAALADILKAIELFKDLFFLIGGIFELDQAKEGGRDVIAYKAIAALLERAATMLRGKIRSYQRLIRERGRMYISHVQNWYTEERWTPFEERGEQKAESFTGTDLIMPVRLTVVSGSTLPKSDVQRREEAIELRKLGVIDDEGCLEFMEFPNWQKIVQRMQMGPIGEFIQRLVALELPEQIGQFLSQLASLEDREFEKALNAGQLPSLAGLGGEQPEQEPSELEQAEAQKTQAEIDKLAAETRLADEKVKTEQAEQDVKKAAIDYDEEQQKIERAKVVAAIEINEVKAELDAMKIEVDALKTRELGKRSETKRQQGKRGLKTDNK